MSSMLEVIEVTKSFNTPGQFGSKPVLQGITLKLGIGESLVIAGPSGSGKSTLLNIIGALDVPTGGKVIFDGRDLSGLSDNELAAIRNKEIGFVFQLHHLLPQCTVLENVLIPSLAANGQTARKDVHKRAMDLLKRVGLSDFLQYRPAELSGGQRQRAAVVRALINKPRLLLADEPTGSLDSESADNIARLLVELNKSEQVSLIVVTHSMHLAQQIGPVMELSDGRLTNRSSR
jgi:lipoprotein-releasing system ATP-binding protein